MKNFHEAFSGTSMDDMETAIRMIVHDSDLYFMIASLAGYLAGAGIGTASKELLAYVASNREVTPNTIHYPSSLSREIKSTLLVNEWYKTVADVIMPNGFAFAECLKLRSAIKFELHASLLPTLAEAAFYDGVDSYVPPGESSR